MAKDEALTLARNQLDIATRALNDGAFYPAIAQALLGILYLQIEQADNYGEPG